MGKNIETIDEYIQQFNPVIREKLQTLRCTIRKAAPDATEKISYRMPTFYLYGNLVHFAAFQNHIGFYPASSGIEAFLDELSAYKTSKGTMQFPMDRPLPLELVRRIVFYRVRENTSRQESKIRK